MQVWGWAENNKQQLSKHIVYVLYSMQSDSLYSMVVDVMAFWGGR